MKKIALLSMILFICMIFAACGKENGNMVENDATGTAEPSKESVVKEDIKVQESMENKEVMVTEEPTEAGQEALTPVPAGYLKAIEQAGTIEIVEYEGTQEDGTKIAKKAYVYLPYGYDENKQYDIIYCLHGGEGSTTAYLGTDKNPAAVKKLLDNMIANGDMKPIIAVAPTYYEDKSNGSNMSISVSKIENFAEYEMINEMIPAVEGKYSTYAETTDLEGLKASRKHRAYTGFSMGSLSTWYTFLYDSDYFYYYMPMSGDCWINGTSSASGAAKKLEQHCVDKGYDGDDFFIYAVTGDKDIAYDAMKAQIEKMQKDSPSFRFVTGGTEEGNICFKVEPNATHDYKYLPLYFYNALPLFFK